MLQIFNCMFRESLHCNIICRGYEACRYATIQTCNVPPRWLSRINSFMVIRTESIYLRKQMPTNILPITFAAVERQKKKENLKQALKENSSLLDSCGKRTHDLPCTS